MPDWAVGTCSLPGGLYFISFFKIRLDLFYLITNKVSPQLPNEAAAPLLGVAGGYPRCTSFIYN